jgi:hypothetical protein
MPVGFLKRESHMVVAELHEQSDTWTRPADFGLAERIERPRRRRRELVDRGRRLLAHRTLGADTRIVNRLKQAAEDRVAALKGQIAELKDRPARDR